MPYIDVTFELVTPAYAGGADTTRTDGPRPPTLKALLRFWWRTTHPDLLPGELFEAEERIFGSTKVGQGLRVVPLGRWGAPRSDPVGTLEKDPLHVYFAYGPVSWDRLSRADRSRPRPGASVLKTPRTRQGESVGLRLRWRDDRPAGLQDDLRKTLWLAAAFGTLGSRARRGWGSLRLGCEFGPALTDPHSGADRSATQAILAHGLKAIFRSRSATPLPHGLAEPRHTAFSPRARLALGPAAPTGERALKVARDLYYEYHRALGAVARHPPGRVGPDFKKRATWLATPPAARDTTPRGSAFGLPHNAQFSRPSRRRVEVGVGNDLKGRRASPVFFKVLRCGAEFVPVVLWMPALFLPRGRPVCVRVDGAGATELKYGGDDAIAAFFDGDPSLTCPAGGGRPLPWRGLAGNSWQEVAW